MLSPGTELAGYRLEELLGRGGMGTVYRAEHRVLRRKAAVKTLLPELAGDEQFLARFIHESQLVAAIEHPNIIPIYDAGEADGVAYIAMRLVEGDDLGELIEKAGPLEPARALEILDGAAAALDAAHARDVVHRDVKPGNVLVDGTASRVYLTDFGIARQLSVGDGDEGAFAATIDYAAPEQLQEQGVSPATDVYALTCVLYECVTARKPFERETDVAVVYAHLLDPPPAVTAERAGLPRGLDDVVARGLAKVPEERFPTCRELVEAARAAVGRGMGAPARRDVSAAHGIAPSLPAPSSPLLGRDAERAELEALLRDDGVRVTTLLGPGGVGKTRLAIDVARGVPDVGPAVFVDLAMVRDPDLVGAAIADACALGESAGLTVAEALSARLGDASLLLLLDNFEHVRPAAGLVADLADAVPSVKALITSQSPLGIGGERQYVLDPLEPQAAADLFVARAREVRPDFEPDGESRVAVEELCARLDGLPLAVELAAARVKVLGPEAILRRLDQRLDLLAARGGGRPERQQTLRDTIGWSHDLLDEAEQAIFARLGVFVGGCSLEAAEAVCGGAGRLGLGPVLDAVASLVDKSLVRQDEDADGEPRFRLLESVREFALERLAERGELPEVRRLHAERYLLLAEMAEPELTRSAQATWLGRLDEEHGNLRAALAWSLEAGEVELGLRIAGALPRYWSTRGHMAEGRRWLRDALARADGVDEAVRAKGLFAEGYAALGLGDFDDAGSSFERALEAARSVGDRRLEGAALAQLGWLAGARGDPGATDLADASLDRARSCGDKLTMSGALNVLGDIALARGDLAGALGRYEESLGLRRQLGDDRLIANSLLNLGRAALLSGDVDRGEERFREALEIARRVGDTWSESVALVNRGRVELLRGAAGPAVESFRAALAIASERGDRRLLAECLHGLAAALVESSPHRAGTLWGAAAAALADIGGMPSPIEAALDETLPQLRARTRDADFAAGEAAGRALSLDEAVELAAG